MKIITLCGSTKYKKQFEQANAYLTLQGNIVISLAFFEQSEGFEITREQAEQLGEIHSQKIDISDEIFVIDVDGYIGRSTVKEIDYAKDKGKAVRYYSNSDYNGYSWQQSRVKAVLQDISHRQIDHIYCLGDVVGIGPDSNQVFDLLFSRKDISYVIGNHDLAVIAAFHGEVAPKVHNNEREHHQWLADRISPEFIEIMGKWPMKLTLTSLNRNILFAHYHLQDKWFAAIDKHPSVENLEKIYKDTEYKLICFGHHHIVHHFIAYKPMARYGIVTLSDYEIMEERIEVPYDNKEFLKSYHRLQVPEREFILKIFHGG